MDGENSTWWVQVETEEQRQRALASGVYLYECPEYAAVHRHRKDQFFDYAVALQNGLEWTHDRAMLGLLPRERGTGRTRPVSQPHKGTVQIAAGVIY